MNILFILQYYKIGGVQTVTHVLSNKFVQEGHNCNVLTLTPSKGEEIHPILNSRIGVSVIDSHTLSTKEAIIQLRNFLIDKNVDVIINQSGHLFRTTALIKNASKDLNIKIISVLHNTPSFGLKFRYKHNITGKLKYYKNILKLAYSYRKVYKNSDLYILLSESFISEFEKISRLKNLKKIRLISNPITIANEDFIYNFERKEKQIIFVGRLEYTQKRIERILNVWGKIQSEYKDLELTIVGDGPDILRLKNITENKNIQSVKFVGFQNPKSFYEKASILLLTSDYEGFPLTITESMNFGVIPIVYGSYSAAYDIISDNYSGMISKPNNGFDEEDFTNKLKMLLSSVTKRKDFSLNALNDSRRFLLNNIYEKWEKIL